MKHINSILILLVLLLNACNLPSQEQTEINETLVDPFTPTESPSPVPPTETLIPSETPLPTAPSIPSAYGPTNFPPDVNPLTGKKVNDPAKLERAPLATKIQVFPRGQRPPWGLSLADIVYDYYQNNGLTRFHAIFLGTDVEQVGPIRSARLFDGELANMYQSVFAFGGADWRILNKLYNGPAGDRLVTEGYANCPPLCRIDPNGFNFLMTNTVELSNYATQNGIPNGRQNLDGMSFNTAIPSGGQPGERVTLRYSISAYNRWDYDPTSGRYLRFQDAQEASDISSESFIPLTDQLTGQQIAAENVVVIFAPHEFTSGSKPGKTEIVDINLDGSGQAIAFRDGQQYDVAWQRPQGASVLYLTNQDGSPFSFKPGNTWFQVVGQSTTSQTLNDGTLHLQFSFP